MKGSKRDVQWEYKHFAFSSSLSVGWAECHGLMWGDENVCPLSLPPELRRAGTALVMSLLWQRVTVTAALTVPALLHPLSWFDWKSYLECNRKTEDFFPEFIEI